MSAEKSMSPSASLRSLLLGLRTRSVGVIGIFLFQSRRNPDNHGTLLVKKRLFQLARWLSDPVTTTAGEGTVASSPPGLLCSG